ncbi:polysaccharide biosynthesis C-terminal domain-containing protein [Lentilactobacillus hilgardii]|nr:polysaccharide biosynthesis C-terminal domain-containing protein [Lentilactobacillus hilgardii]MCV3743088.1 polysaccharide biosynthesis C-terminal domain-containing protein [Lentilactobacillus hilgardii]
MQLIKNFLYNASYQVFILLVPLITTPYIARVLGPNGIGINAYTNSIIQYFVLFGSIGVDLYGNRQIAFVRSNKKKLTQTFYEIFIMRFFTILLAYCIFLVFLFFTNQYRGFYLAQSVQIIAAAFDISWFFMGMEAFSVTVIRNLVIRILTIASIFIFINSYNDLRLYILILSISTLVGNATLFPNLRKYITLFPKLKLHPWKHFKPSLIMFLPQIATQIYLVLNKTMLGSIDSVNAAGFFEQSDKIVKMVLAVVTATGTVMLPHVANVFARGDKKKTKDYLYNSFSFVTALALPMTWGLLAIAPKLIDLFLTPKFRSVIPIMSIETVVIILIAWSNVIGTQYLLPTKQLREYTQSVVIGAVINLMMNIPLILAWGAIGSAIATVISEITVTGYQLFAIRKQIKFRLLFADFGKYLLASVLMFTFVYLIDRLAVVTWLMLFLEILLGILIYLVLILAMRVRLVNLVKSIFNSK